MLVATVTVTIPLGEKHDKALEDIVRLVGEVRSRLVAGNHAGADVEMRVGNQRKAKETK